jgi:predicted AlkP superfamily pyrophosphatase or phosphodiesterase
MRRTVVLNVVGLTRGLIGSHTPRLQQCLNTGAHTLIDPALPAVTCTAQANYLTGVPPSRHGIVANGWYNRDLAEVHFWKQSNHLVGAPKIWHTLRHRDPSFTCAKLFWWYNMFADVEYSITPRPMYPADGRKVFDIYTWPYSLRPELKASLGEFPFPTFWGPAAGIQSPQGRPDATSQWIAGSARWIESHHQPTLSLVYLPHLDYNLQRYGPNDPRIADDLRRIDTIVGSLLDFFNDRNVQIIILSEYGITPVNTPVHLNRLFRNQGWLVLKEELGRELPDFGQSDVFAIADHQVAHIHLKNFGMRHAVRTFLECVPGVDYVLDPSTDPHAAHLHHPRAGDLIAVAKENAWFTYYYWENDAKAPDFARTVDIHRKPGYDPVELFLDPAIPAVKLRIARRLLQKKLGFRMLMDDALDRRPAEGVRDAIEDAADAVKDAAKDVKDTAKDIVK